MCSPVVVPFPCTASADRSRLPTFREEQVIDLIAEGRSNCEIASHLGISEETVKRHLSNIFDKTGYRTRLQLAVQRLTARHRYELAQLRATAA